MSTLLFQLVAPLQSWGVTSRFSERDTSGEPSKSGVIGLVGAALGTLRHDIAGISRLADLRLGIRVDREGTLVHDFHTALGVARADGRPGKADEAVLSHRYYLADAAFLVGLEGDEGLLCRIDAALDAPHFPIFLGRKACIPSAPPRLRDGLRAVGLEAALREYPRIAGARRPRRGETLDATPERLRLTLDAGPDEEGEMRRDVPISFELGARAFRTRSVVTKWAESVPRGTGELAEGEHVHLAAQP